MILQLKIQLDGISKPPVWRKVLVPAQFTFEKLHFVIQAAFGWEDYHLYSFSPNGYSSTFEIGKPYENDNFSGRTIKDSRKVKLSSIFQEKGQKYTYIYDFGDDWNHKITVEEIIDQEAIRAELVSGKGACPPEDCGGIWGYQSLLEIVNDPKHPEYEEMREWLCLDDDDEWDVNYFELEDAKAVVAMI